MKYEKKKVLRRGDHSDEMISSPGILSRMGKKFMIEKALMLLTA
jgi:hypothetical protein